MEKNKEKNEIQSRKCFRLFITVYIYALIFISIILSLVLQLVCCVIFFPLILFSRKHRYTIPNVCFKLCCCIVCVLNPFWKIKTIRKYNKNRKYNKTIFFINHLSSSDPWVIAYGSMIWNMKFVFKSSLFKIPIAGICLSLSGDIPVYFTKEKGGWELKSGTKEKLMATCKKFHELDIPILVFPEGTRSLNGQLQLFKSGFFQYAVENDCEIVPCALCGTDKLWPVKANTFDKGTAYISFGEPIRPSPGITYKELKDKTRSIILEMIKEFPIYDKEKHTLASELTKVRGHGL